jgi:transcriptional regulator with XRE-family HTH domain
MSDELAKKKTLLLTDQVRQAIEDSGLTRYRIAKETGISESALSQFYNGQRGLSMNALNALGQFLQLKVTLGRKRPKKGK